VATCAAVVRRHRVDPEEIRMAKLLEFPTPDGDVRILVREPQDVVGAVGVTDKAIERVDESLDEVLAVARRVATSVRDALKGAPVESAEVEFGLQLSSKGSVYIFEAGAQATLVVRLTVNPASPG
jgi:hypothetical protein